MIINKYQEENKSCILHDAIKINYLQKVHMLLEQGVDIHEKDYSDLTPIFVALEYSDDVAIFEELLKHGAFVSEMNVYGRTPLYEAVRLNKSVKIIKTFLKYKADINGTVINGRSALHLALLKFNLVVIEELIKGGCDVNIKDCEGKTALHYAVENEYPMEVIQRIASAGANINAEDNNGKTALHYLFKNGYSVSDIEKFLEYDVDIHVKDKTGRTPLFYMVQHGYSFEVILSFLAYGANAKDTDNAGRSPLHYLSEHNYKAQSILILGCHQGGDVNTKDIYGKTLLHTVLEKGYSVEIIRGILSLMGNIKAVDFDGKNVLHVAMVKSNAEVIQELLNLGANVNGKDYTGKTPLNYGLHQKCCFENVEVILNNHMIDVNTKDNSGCSPLHYAASECDLRTIQALLSSGSNVNSKDMMGDSPLCNAVKNSRPKNIIAELLKYGASVHNSMKWHSLMQYRNKSIYELIKYSLLEHVQCKTCEVLYMWWSVFVKHCRNEISNMKKAIVVGDKMLFDFVVRKYDYGKFFSTHNDLIEFFKTESSLQHKYLIYYNIIISRLETRAYLLRKLDDVNMFVTNNQGQILVINSVCVKMIGQYLREDYLKNFYEAIRNK